MPFFSVGITTYQRHEPLKQAIRSVLDSTYGDLEILVGNDYQGETLTEEMLGIADPRVRILNHPVNLREIGNMNALFHAGKGRYFTWIADDDFCSPYFFERVKKAIDTAGKPNAVFTSYEAVHALPPPDELAKWKENGATLTLVAERFLAEVLSGRRKAMGFCGVFEMEFLQNLGGVEPIVESAPVGLYSEYLMLVKAAAAGKPIPYVDAPLTFYNPHSDSWGVSNRLVELYREAGPLLIRKAMPHLLQPAVRGSLRDNLLQLLTLAIDNYYAKCCAGNRFLDSRAARDYRRALSDACGDARALPDIDAAFARFQAHFNWILMKARVRRLLPPVLLRIVERVYQRTVKLGESARVPG